MSCKHAIKPWAGYGVTTSTHRCKHCGIQVVWKFNRYIRAQPHSWFILDGIAYIFGLFQDRRT